MDETSEQNVPPTPPTPVPPVEPSEPAPNKRSSIRTLHSDVAASVHDNNLSITKIALAQQEKNASLPFIVEEETHFWSAWSIGSIVLIVAGILIVMGTVGYLILKNVSIPFMNSAEPMVATLVPVESQEQADTTRTTRVDFLTTIDAFMNADYSSPIALEALILTEMVGTSTIATPLTLERFFERVGTRAPGRFIRSVGPDMTLGRAGDTPFLMTPASSYETAFAGLLEWEEFIAEDLSFIAGKLPEPPIIEPAATSSDTIAASTSSTTPIIEPAPLPPPPAPEWKDIIVKNQDVRALIAHDDTILMLYAFTSDDTLIITRTKEAFLLIMTALNAPVFGN